MDGTAAAIVVLLLLLAVVVGAGLWCRKQQPPEYQHGQAGAVHNPAYVVDVDAATPRRNSVVVTDSNQQQFLVPMAAYATGGGGGGDGDDGDDDSAASASAGGSSPTSAEYLSPVARNDNYTYAPPMPAPTPRQGIPVNSSNSSVGANGANPFAVPAKDADGYVVDEYVRKDVDGYVVDDFVPDGGVDGNPIVYATVTYNAGTAEHGAGNSGAVEVYSVPTLEGDTIEVYASAAGGIESNA